MTVAGADASDNRTASDATKAPYAPTYEASGGADVAPRSRTFFAGGTAALFGDIRQDGWRIRSNFAFSEYRYARSYWDAVTKQETGLAIRGTRTSVDALVGYQGTLGPTTLKLFAGVVQETKEDAVRQPAPILHDDESGLQGSRIGARLVLETWTRLSDWGFLQADFGWSQPLDGASGRVRLGYRIGAHWSLGLEAAAYGSPVPDQGRAGAFLRAEWERGETSVSVGAAGDDRGIEGVYGTLNALFRF